MTGFSLAISFLANSRVELINSLNAKCQWKFPSRSMRMPLSWKYSLSPRGTSLYLSSRERGYGLRQKLLEAIFKFLDLKETLVIL